MPDEYISREAALKDFEASNAENPNWTPQRVKTLLLRQPAADVAEVVHGTPVTEVRTRTIVGYHEEIGVLAGDRSTLYRRNMVHADIPYDYCPVCGATLCSRWHISDLRVYDHPRDLWEFTGLRETKFGLAPGPITRPPQSWRYVEEETWND